MATPGAGTSSSSASTSQDCLSAPQANAAAAAATLSNPHVEAGLNSTAVLHGAMSELYAAGVAAAAAPADGETTVTLPLATLKRWRKHAARANKAVATHARDAFVREDRLSVELAMLRIAARNDILDRDAHIAHLLERIRELGEMQSVDALATTSMDAIASANAGASSSADAAPAPAPVTKGDVDAAITSAQRVEAALAQLSPIGVLNLHGTPNLAYLNLHPEVALAADAAAAAASAGEAASAALTADPPEIPGQVQAPAASAR